MSAASGGCDKRGSKPWLFRRDNLVPKLLFEEVCDSEPVVGRFATCLGLALDVDAGVKQGQDVTNCTSWLSVKTWSPELSSVSNVSDGVYISPSLGIPTSASLSMRSVFSGVRSHCVKRIGGLEVVSRSLGITKSVDLTNMLMLAGKTDESIATISSSGVTRELIGDCSLRMECQPSSAPSGRISTYIHPMHSCAPAEQASTRPAIDALLHQLLPL